MPRTRPCKCPPRPHAAAPADEQRDPRPLAPESAAAARESSEDSGSDSDARGRWAAVRALGGGTPRLEAAATVARHAAGPTSDVSSRAYRRVPRNSLDARDVAAINDEAARRHRHAHQRLSVRLRPLAEDSVYEAQMHVAAAEIAFAVQEHAWLDIDDSHRRDTVYPRDESDEGEERVEDQADSRRSLALAGLMPLDPASPGAALYHHRAIVARVTKVSSARLAAVRLRMLRVRALPPLTRSAACPVTPCALDFAPLFSPSCAPSRPSA